MDPVDVKIPVRFLDGTINVLVGVDKLVTDNGQIMAIPVQLYDVVDGDIQLCDAVSPDFEALSHSQVQILSDEEWALLIDAPSDECDVAADELPEKRKRTRVCDV